MIWGRSDLLQLLADARKGRSLAEMATRQFWHPEATAQAVDLALWAKLGRSTSDALDVLNGRQERRG